MSMLNMFIVFVGILCLVDFSLASGRSSKYPSRYHQPDDDMKPFFRHEKVDKIQGGITGVVDHSNGRNDPMIVVDMPDNHNPDDHKETHILPIEPRVRFPVIETPPHYPDELPNLHRLFMQTHMEWWNGPNVCTERQEIDESVNETQTGPFILSYHTTNCVDNEQSHVCTTRLKTHGIHKTYIVSHRCCHGYERNRNAPGCEKTNLTPVMDTLRSIGGGTFADLIHFSGLEDKFQTQNLTVFCPTDDAMKAFQENLDNNAVIMDPNVHRHRTSDQSNDHIVLAHAVGGFLRSEDFIDEKILLTEASGAGIRTNVYRMPNRVVTANCGKILSINNFATNGVVHMVSRVLAPLTKTVADIIAGNPNYSIFKMFLDRTNLFDLLHQLDGHFTVLVPTDEAFRQLDPSFLTKLLEGEGCVESIIKYHILPNVVCREVLPQRARSTTLLGSDVKVRRPDEDRFLVNDIPVNDGDAMGTNGIVYGLDGVLLPSQGKPLTAVLDEWQLTDLIKLLEENKIMNKLETMQNFTFFAPTNEAVRRARSTIDVLADSPEKLQDMLMYHVAFPSVPLCNTENNMQLKTAVAEKPVRFNHFHSRFGMTQQMTIQCAPIIPLDGQICKGTVQIIEKVLFPPEGHLIDVLSSNQSFSIFRRLLRKADMEDELLNHGPFTVLAPTDSAFYSLPEEILALILDDPKHAKAVARNHILPEILCCAGIPHSDWVYHNSVRAVNGNVHSLRRTYAGMYVGSARFIKCDIMADNGVVQAIGRVLLPSNAPRRNYHGF